jgi:putative RNA 2'-phosphotransferase
MTDPALIERITRSLAFMLRHQPETFDLELDSLGYADLGDVVQALNERLGEPVEEEDVREAVVAGDRPRYEIVEDRIRALYGHSIPVEPGPSSKPPESLYVAVPEQELERARRFGLRGGRRRFLHLAISKEDAAESGRRASRDYTVLVIHALDAWEEGVSFYDRTALWLAEEVPTHLIEVEGTYHDGTEPEGRRFDAPREHGGRDRERERGREQGGRRGRRGRGRGDRHHEHREGPGPERHGESGRGGPAREQGHGHGHERAGSMAGSGERGRRPFGREGGRDERGGREREQRDSGQHTMARERAPERAPERPERGHEGRREERRPERSEEREHRRDEPRREGRGDSHEREQRRPPESAPRRSAPGSSFGAGIEGGEERRERKERSAASAPEPPPPPPPQREERPPVEGPRFGAGL